MDRLIEFHYYCERQGGLGYYVKTKDDELDITRRISSNRVATT